jgi:ribosomal protein L34E
MSVSAPSTSKNVKQHRCNICNMILDSIETLDAHNRMEHSEARHSPAGVS